MPFGFIFLVIKILYSYIYDTKALAVILPALSQQE